MEEDVLDNSRACLRVRAHLLNCFDTWKAWLSGCIKPNKECFFYVQPNRSHHPRLQPHPGQNLAVTAMLSAVAFMLMFLDFTIPFLIPSFVQMDFSELPALLASFSLGPVYGVMVCLVKNLIHLTITSTGGAGELCNFLLGACFVPVIFLVPYFNIILSVCIGGKSKFFKLSTFSFCGKK